MQDYVRVKSIFRKQETLALNRINISKEIKFLLPKILNNSTN